MALNCTDEGEITIMSSKYGHMVKTSSNNTKSEGNCSGTSNVRSFIKGRCEHKIICEIELPERELDALSPCLKAALLCLEIVYQCINCK